MARTLADRFTQRDADRFVGRAAELAVFDEILVGDPPASVVIVHGPGGIGKSALLREAMRRGTDRGFSPWLVDARELAPVPGELETVLAGARGEERPLILFDSYERMSGLGGFLRETVVPALPDGAVVVLASREPPQAGWFQGGWEHLVRTIALKPLDGAEGRDLVTAYGVDDGPQATSLLRWAQGSPLALSLGAAVMGREGGWSDADFAQSAELIAELVRRLALTQVEGDRADVTAVAAIARITTATMLAEVLGTEHPTDDQAWLRAQPITQAVGDGVMMHDLVRKAVRSHLRAAQPDHERELRRRIADHLLARAAAGEPRLMVDLAELVENPALRWGYGAEGVVGLRPDGIRRSDFEGEPSWGDRPGGEAWWAATLPLFRDSPEHIVTVRDDGDAIRGMAISFTPANASPTALADPFVGGWIGHAREHALDGNALIWRDSLDLTASEEGDTDSRVLAIANTAAILRSGLVNPRLLYLPINPVNVGAVAFATHSGARHIPELDVRVGEALHECHVIDHGPDGFLGSQRDIIYAELGLKPPRPGTSMPKEVVAVSVTADDVRQGMRDLDRPSALAASPLAALTRGADPAGEVHALLVAAATDAFGSGPEEEMLRQVVDRAYVNHSTSHEQAAHDLHMSRATYFRRLRQVTDRVADYVIALSRVEPPA